MKTTNLLARCALLLALSTLTNPLSTSAQGTAFTYQGRLNVGGTPANGSYDLLFSLYNAPSGGQQVGGSVQTNGVSISNGLFTTTVDFGAGVFYGSSYWLQISVRTNGNGAFTALNSSLQALTPTPYSMFSESAYQAYYAGTAAAVANDVVGPLQLQTLNAPSPGQVLAFNGAFMTWTNPAGGGGGGSGWSLTGNGGTTPGIDFLGTTDNQPLELWVNGFRALRLEGLVANGQPNVIGGAAQNSVGVNLYGATIGGGFGNTVGGTYGSYATLSGGELNAANGFGAAVGGGYHNTASDSSFYNTVGGGTYNTAGSNYATVSGGYHNSALGQSATVPGGSSNSASGDNSFAAGHMAQAPDQGAFVWADSQNTFFSSTLSNQFSVRARGGVRFETAGAGLTVDGVAVTGGGGGGGSGWSLTGNGGTSPDTGNFLGTTDNEPLELHVHGSRALRLEPGFGGYPNIIGGWSGNTVASAGGATIGGGGYSGSPNSVSASFGTIGGGYANTNSGQDGTVAGGYLNAVTSTDATVSGGSGNTASGAGATVAGGYHNLASGAGAFVGGGGYDGTTYAGNSAVNPAATVGGGLQNAASSPYATVSGGSLNTAYGANATVPGGYFNTAGGTGSFAAGQHAEAQHPGSFVWSDSSAGFFASTASDQFSVRASGGMRFFTGGNGLYIDGTLVVPGGGGGGGSGWSLTGNHGTDPATDFLGTTDGAELQLRVNNFAGIRLDYAQSATGSVLQHNLRETSGVNVNGGYWHNSISNGVVGSTIAGGGYLFTFSQGLGLFGQEFTNTVNANFGTVGGGANNSIGGGSDAATIAGGRDNVIDPNVPSSTISGGQSNVIVAGSSYSTIPGGLGNTILGNDCFVAGQYAGAFGNGNFVWADASSPNSFTAFGNNKFVVRAAGGVGINTTTPSQALEVNGKYLLVDGSSGEQAYFGGESGHMDIGSFNSSVTAISFYNQGSSPGFMHLYCSSITIEGGADLAEPFQISAPDKEVPQGAVVVIDEENPGHLRVSDQPYDTRVAGVVSGANGINPGIQMQQQGLLEGGKNVALTGRVYVQADTSNGAIRPGDLLTTSANPGHAMKVSDHGKAQGAILGKAMTGLKDGNGMVLVLVTLQ